MTTRKSAPFLDLPRAFRSTPVPWSGGVFGIILAGAISTGIIRFGSRLLSLHEALRQLVLGFDGIPMTDSIPFTAFASISTHVAQTPMADYRGHPWLLVAVCGGVATCLMALYFRLNLGRTFTVVLMVMLVSSTAQALALPEFGRHDAFLVTFWLRFELIDWILAPWLVAIICTLVEPSLLIRSCWIAAAPGYVFLWSAARLSFCTIALYYAGPALILILWTVFGILSDLVSVCLFYSLIVYFSHFRLRRGSAND